MEQHRGRDPSYSATCFAGMIKFTYGTDYLRQAWLLLLYFGLVPRRDLLRALG